MYRFLIIDDEPLVREGISSAIDWGAHGFELVGTCRDGREGLQALEELRPDVVLTDICMPFVDGLELASSISEQYPAIKTILLTGYDEFEYAQEAVRLNVRDIILKPVTPAELREVLDSLRDELDAERHRKQKYERLQEQLRESIPVLQERFLNSLIHHPIPLAEATQKAELLDLDIPGPILILLLCDRDDGEAADSLDAIAVQNEIAGVTDTVRGAVAFSTADDEVIVLLSLPAQDQAISLALDCAEMISDQVQRSLGRTVSIGIGDAVQSLSDLPRSFHTARVALEQRFVLGANQVTTMQQVRGVASGAAGETPGGEQSDSSDYAGRSRFIDALKMGSVQDAVNAFTDIIRRFRRAESVEYHSVVIHRVLADALNALDSIEIDYREIPNFRGNPFEQLGRIKTIDEIEQWFHLFIGGASHLLESRRMQHSHRKAVAAVDYIEKHFAQPDLSLQAVCSVLAVSKSYLSPIFKNHTAMTFVEYLTAVRMREAQALLSRTDQRVYEIAEQVGFREAHYFSLTFRKQTGLSPSEYRDQSRERQGA